jgi:NAD(P)-dependent dehydrogenase (short-subunit alcohol dehydrogenase family)
MFSNEQLSIRGKRVLLVGATGVLGRGYAKAFADGGARLVIADLPSSDVLDFASTIGATGVEMDVGSEVSVVAGVSQAGRILDGLDGVVNNAAVTGEGLLKLGKAFAPFEEYPLELWQRALDVNLTGSFLVARETGKIFRDQKTGGSLVNVCSTYGLVGPDHRIYEGQEFKSFAAYSASKAGILGLTRWLATWWGDSQIRVNCVTPGGVYNNHNDRFVEAYARRTPLGRMADRSDLVGIFIYLLSDASSYCTGQNFIVDGGFTAW